MVIEAAGLTMKDYKSETKPTWCPGCGDFGVLSATFKALTELQKRVEEVVVVSGIGCSSRIPYFLATYGLHTLHGRSIPVAEGVKLANPKLTVFAMGGDGDLLSIGGAHLAPAASRNIDITVVCMDNQIYGLTKNQASPTTELGHTTKSSPYGVVTRPANPVLWAIAYGATFVARGYSAKPKLLTDLIVAGVKHQGFSFIHVQSPCAEFHKTFDFLDTKVAEMPSGWDTSNLAEAIKLAATEEQVHLGVFYETQRPTFEVLARTLEKKVKPRFDADEYLSRFA